MRKYTVVVEWAGRPDEFDADEIVVYSDSASAAAAEGKARQKWRTTIGARWPHLFITKAVAYRPQELRELVR